MFYSHDILTSREHGVATVWLVATLGSRSSLKSFTRKKILDVDVHRACDTIQNPEAPMALRLQGNLLYGVARVYSQQCGYVLADAQAVRDKVRGVSMIMKELALDQEAGRARTDQLNLPDDPAFMPELDLNFDFSAFNLPMEISGRSSLMSPPSLVSSRSSQQAAEEAEEPTLELPSGDTSFGAKAGGFDLGLMAGVRSVGRSASMVHGPSVFEEETGILDVDWEFDEHGNMIETAQAPKPSPIVQAVGDVPASRMVTDSAINARVRQEHAEGLQATRQGLEFDEGMLAFGEDERVLSEARPFSPLLPQGGPETGQPHLPVSPGQPVEEAIPSKAVSAPQRRARTVKPLKFDERPGLTNDELRQWNEEYLANMQEAAEAKQLSKLAHQNKRNAEHWVIGQGIGGVGNGLGQNHTSGPLHMFSGATLLAAVTGRELGPVGAKHARNPSVTSAAEEEDRRVRVWKERSEQIGRGAGEEDLDLAVNNEETFVGGDEMDVELGRTAPEELPEGRSSQMPWDLYSASRQGLAPPFGSAAVGMTSSAGGPARGFEVGPPSALSRRVSRLTTASPLQGRGFSIPLSQRISIISTPEGGRLATSDGLHGVDENFGGELPQLGDETEDFHLYGPAAAVDTQTAAQSQWVAAALDSESRNFLDFLDAQIQAQIPLLETEQEDDGKMPRQSATFERLLRPSEHTKMVAAQAFLHVLTLASKNLVTVKQNEGFGDIELAIAVDA